LTDVPPTSPSDYSNPVLVATSTTSAIILQYRPAAVASSSGAGSFTINVDGLYAAFSVADSTFSETHGQLVMLDTAGTATGVRFAWPGGAALGGVQVAIWNLTSGTPLGTNATPFVVPAQGVYTVNFDTPVSLSAFNLYMIGVWRSDGSAHSTVYATNCSWLAPANNGNGATVMFSGISHSFIGPWYYSGGAGVRPASEVTGEAYPVQLIFTIP
jgi:hypothetical protein